jgi:hypothetical protein
MRAVAHARVGPHREWKPAFVMNAEFPSTRGKMHMTIAALETLEPRRQAWCDP